MNRGFGLVVDVKRCFHGNGGRRHAAGTRLQRLPRAEVLGSHFPVARGLRARLFGLALLGLDDAGPGLLIPRCRCVHTFGLRFSLDLVFLGRYGEALEVRRSVPPRRVICRWGASAVLELPVSGKRV